MYKDKKKLEGAIFDLYKSIRWCETVGYNITVITDITLTQEIINTLIFLELKEDVYNFLTIINNATIHTITNTQDFLKSLTSSITLNKTFIYYSGHGINNHMLMPNNDSLPFTTFRNIILKNPNDIFCVLDCCNPQGLHLPFKYTNNTFTLSDKEIKCIKQNILLITSCDSNEKSISSPTGSIFTKFFFKNLYCPYGKKLNIKSLIHDISININKINNKINHKQTISLYSSYIVPPILPLWLFPNPSCYISLVDNVILLKKIT